ncbi:hypothetical protein PR048_031570 [Dryococelus australis]|uniref:Uncharacterized protein n=1 Tax=Dryococelus australis TaxID=614101 RepID=A0ABQ9G6P9_9NEOP|nr:hypothetical protein PR048_031570 [Dryococelus australis]
MKVSEHGILKPNANGSGNVLVKKDYVQFVSPEGTPFSLSYITDENGYHVKSDSIPPASLGANASLMLIFSSHAYFVMWHLKIKHFNAELLRNPQQFIL